MNKMNWFVLCPVPRDQRPFYEYLKRKQSSFVGWVGLNEIEYTKKFFFTFLFLFILVLPINSWFISILYYPIEAILSNLLICLVIQTLLYIYFYFNWQYIGKRLINAKVSYEESGWYDGRIWIKPPSILKHERLLYHYQLVPLITRLTKTIQFLFLSLLFTSTLLFLFIY